MSGVYLARGQQFVELLQLTPSRDGQLMGTLNHVAVKPDGSLDRFTLNIHGTTDGRSITLAAQVTEPFATANNMSGTEDSDSINLMQPNGQERFVMATSEAYQATVNDLTAQAQALPQKVAQANAQKEMNTHQARLFTVARSSQITCGCEPKMPRPTQR